LPLVDVLFEQHLAVRPAIELAFEPGAHPQAAVLPEQVVDGLFGEAPQALDDAGGRYGEHLATRCRGRRGSAGPARAGRWRRGLALDGDGDLRLAAALTGRGSGGRGR